MGHRGRHRLPISLALRGSVAWERKSCFFTKHSGSRSRLYSCMWYFHIYETNFLLNLTPKLFGFLEQMFTSSHAPSNSTKNFLQKEGLPKQPSSDISVSEKRAIFAKDMNLIGISLEKHVPEKVNRYHKCFQISIQMHFFTSAP